MNEFMIDLHGYTEEQAKKIIFRLLKNLPDSITELKIIHGYHSGTKLADTVRNLKSKRIHQKIRTLNPGETIYILNTKNGSEH